MELSDGHFVSDFLWYRFYKGGLTNNSLPIILAESKALIGDGAFFEITYLSLLWRNEICLDIHVRGLKELEGNQRDWHGVCDVPWNGTSISYDGLSGEFGRL